MLPSMKQGRSLKVPGILKGIAFIVFPKVGKILRLMLHIDTRFRLTVIVTLVRIVT
jgi:hypothetical protein